MRELITGGNELVALAAIESGCRFFWWLSHYAFKRNCPRDEC